MVSLMLDKPEQKSAAFWSPCSRCVGGQMFKDSDGDRVCLQCGERVCSDDMFPYYKSPNPELPAHTAYGNYFGLYHSNSTKREGKKNNGVEPK